MIMDQVNTEHGGSIKVNQPALFHSKPGEAEEKQHRDNKQRDPLNVIEIKPFIFKVLYSHAQYIQSHDGEEC